MKLNRHTRNQRQQRVVANTNNQRLSKAIADLEAGAAGSGNVSNTGTPVDNQLAVWTAATTIEGDANLTWNGTDMNVGGALTVDNAGGTDPNFIIQGDGEQTMRFYNNAASGSKRVSWKMANRTNTDWEFIMYTDVSGDGTESFKLQGRTAGNALVVRDGAVRVEGEFHSDGNVGIGTTSPETSLHISSVNPNIRLEDTDAAVDAKQWNISAGNTDLLRFQALSDADAGGGNYFEFERSGNQITQFAGVKSGTRWFTINNTDQRVGICELSPASKLHITEDTTGTYLVTFEGDLGTNNNRTLRLKTPSTDSSSEPFTWQTGNSVAWQIDAAEAMRLNSAGNLGIATTSPSSPLTVAGVIESTTGGVKFPDGTTQTTASEITKVGTTANDELAVWTGDGTLDGDSNLTWSSGGQFYMQTTNNTAFRMNNTSGGNARMRFDISGTQKFSMGVNGSNDSFTIYQANGYNTTPFTIFAAAPSNSFYIAGDGEVALGSSTVNGSLCIVSNDNTDSGPDKSIRMGHHADSARSATLTKSRNFAGDDAELTLKTSTGTSGSPFTIYNTSTNEAMRVNDDGNVGINTTSPATELDVSGTITATDIQAPPVTQSSGAQTLAAADLNNTIRATGAITVNNSVGAAGDIVIVYNNSASAISITAGTITTMRLDGTTTTGTRNLAARGVGFIFWNSSSEVVVGGTSVT